MNVGRRVAILMFFFAYTDPFNPLVLFKDVIRGRVGTSISTTFVTFKNGL